MAATFHGQLKLGQGSLGKPGLCLVNYANAAGLYSSTTGISGTELNIVFGVTATEQLRLDSAGVKARALWLTTPTTLAANSRVVTRSATDTSIGTMGVPTSNGQVLSGNTNGALLWASVPTGTGTENTFAVWGANNVLRGSSLLREVYPVGLIEQVEANANIIVVRAGGYVKTPNIDISGDLVYRNTFLGAAIIPKLPQDTAVGTMYSLSGNSGGLYVWRESFPLGGTPSGTAAGKVLKLKNALAVGAAPKIADLEWADDLQGSGGGGVGTVTSVAMTVPSVLFTTPVSGSPVTGNGTLALALTTQDANKFFGASDSGAPSLPAFRRILPIDLSATGTTNGFVLSRTGTTTMAWVAPATGGGGGDLTGDGVDKYFAVWTGAKTLRDSFRMWEYDGVIPDVGIVINGHLRIQHSATLGYVVTPNIDVSENLVYRTNGATPNPMVIPRLPHDTSNRMWALNGTGAGAFQWTEFTAGGGGAVASVDVVTSSVSGLTLSENQTTGAVQLSLTGSPFPQKTGTSPGKVLKVKAGATGTGNMLVTDLEWADDLQGSGGSSLGEPNTTVVGSIWVLVLSAAGPPKVWVWKQLVGENVWQ